MLFIKNHKHLLIFCIVATITISCRHADINMNSEYISKVFEYVYAPGQHANMAKKSDVQFFIGNPDNHQGWLYLGGFGGYVTAGFDHNVENKDGADFEVYMLTGNSPEPAVVYVMQDKNGDGKPNEIWYELKGNQFENSNHNYWLSYYKPASDSANITWLDSDGKSGELISGFGSEYSATWWWNETKKDSTKFYGTRLPDLFEIILQNGNQIWTVDKNKFLWGYAENNLGTDCNTASSSNELDISNAVDSNGNSANLSDIRFIKIQTAIFQQAGWLNEVSAEVRGAKELKN